jgi:formate dehydrogenase (coenzyme F420) beta subunit
MRTLLPVENNDVLATLQAFLRQLIESGLVEALYLPIEVEGGLPIPALVTDPVLLEDANPLAPVMPINGARAVSALTGKGAPASIGVVLRPCEQRALIELVKLQQATLENVVLIGLDCPGTYEVSDYHAIGLNLGAYLSAAQKGSEPSIEQLSLRQACRMCVNPVSENSDIKIELFGVDFEHNLPVTMSEEFAEKLGYSEAAPANEGRQTILDRLIDARSQAREQELSSIQEKISMDGNIAGFFEACIRCHNCMTVCPICYCKTCLFKTASFDHPPEHYLKLAHRKGAMRMLGDTLLFHMTRLNHMSASCVSCGMCTSACPADIPVGSIFSAIGSKVQAAFDYVPGRSVTEALPLITFQASEWTEIGEKK